MATGGHVSVRHQKKAINKRSSDENQTVDATCRCRVSKKALCQYCMQSPKRFKLLKGNTSDDLTDEPAVVNVLSVFTDEDGSRFGSRYWDVNFSEYFSKNFKKVLEIKPRFGCFAIRLFKDKIWAPTSTSNCVQVYNTRGTNLKVIDINYPRSIEKAFNGDLFIACLYNSGLYVIGDNEAPQKLCDGSFADVYSYRDKVYALEYEKKVIMEFYCISEAGDVKQRWRSEKKWKIDDTSDHDKLIVTGVKELQFYVSHNTSRRIGLFNTHGMCIKQFGGRQEAGDGILHHASVCGVDRQSHLLVADLRHNVYKILDPSTGQWSSTGVKGEKYVYDATLDDEGNLWLDQSNGKEFIITKHEPQ